MSQLSYTSPVAMPITVDGDDDYRTYRPNRKWLVSVLVNGKRYYYGAPKTFISQYTYCNAAILTQDIFKALPYDTYPQAHTNAGRYLTEASPHGFGNKASAEKVKFMLGLDILPRVKIEIGMVEVTDMEPSWKTHALKPISWNAQYWPDL